MTQTQISLNPINCFE